MLLSMELRLYNISSYSSIRTDTHAGDVAHVDALDIHHSAAALRVRAIRAETRRPLTLATAGALLRCDVDADAGLHVVQLQILVPASRDTGHRKLPGGKGPNDGYS